MLIIARTFVAAVLVALTVQSAQAQVQPQQAQQAQQQQQPQNPPVEDDDEDLYGNDARGEASHQAFIAARKMGLANAESVAVDDTEDER